jgi:hypothetical protein
MMLGAHAPLQARQEEADLPDWSSSTAARTVGDGAGGDGGNRRGGVEAWAWPTGAGGPQRRDSPL